jgi:exopolyphosphatase/guanosine-5'-triphosphate,3'-diphosphate pyrophosphatase
MGGINEGKIAQDALERGLKALAHFKEVSERFQVQEIKGIGTSALRDAINSAEFLEQVDNLLGIHIEVISGEKEAELIYKGVKLSYDFSQPGVIMDIGGGSTEFIFADSKGVNDLISLNIGVSRIYQHFTFHDPLSPTDIQNIENWLEDNSKGFFNDKQEDLLIGASGSFETFYELVHSVPFPEKLHSVEVPFVELMDSLDAIISSTQAERDVNQWIVPIRKKMAPIAAVKTRWVIRKLGVKNVIISPCSLKEGAFM